MSASLVGSEMCIRDRSSPCGPQSRTPASRPRTPARLPRRRASGQPRASCLLYTSDAADDM
eukprot:165664-Alexandrium_andersonii.AAC.1